MKALRKGGMITTAITMGGLLVTICNYDKYQIIKRDDNYNGDYVGDYANVVNDDDSPARYNSNDLSSTKEETIKNKDITVAPFSKNGKKELPSEAKKASKMLAAVIEKHKNIKITASAKEGWCLDIDRLSRLNQIKWERIYTVIEGYDEIYGGEYVPVVESGKSFREKFTKIESAIKRKQSEPEIDPDGREYWKKYSTKGY